MDKINVVTVVHSTIYSFIKWYNLQVETTTTPALLKDDLSLSISDFIQVLSNDIKVLELKPKEFNNWIHDKGSNHFYFKVNDRTLCINKIGIYFQINYI